MAACLISSGFVAPTCSEIFQIPGLVYDRIFLANYSDMTSFSEAATGEVSNISFATYTGLYKIAIHENSGSISEELVLSENAGAYYTESFTARVIDSITAVRNAINNMVGSRMILIVEAKEGDYYIMGLNGGLTMTVNTWNSGAKAGDENGDLITLTGLAKGKRKKFFNTSAAQTKTIVNTYTMA